MKGGKLLIFVVVLALIGSGAGALVWLKKNQKLGEPGIRAVAIPGSIKMDFDLPAQVLDFTSKSEARRRYIRRPCVPHGCV